MVAEHSPRLKQVYEHGSPLLPLGISRQTPSFGPPSAVTLVLTQAIDWPLTLLHSSARSQAAPSTRTPENVSAHTSPGGWHVVDCSSMRAMHAPSLGSSMSNVP